MASQVSGFRCPVCEAPTLVKETRGDLRRRECFNGHRFNTLEITAPERMKHTDLTDYANEAVRSAFQTRRERFEQIATSKLRAAKVAEQYGVNISTVYAYRQKWRRLHPELIKPRTAVHRIQDEPRVSTDSQVVGQGAE